MATPKDWPHAQGLGDWMRQQEKRTMREERRPRITHASDLLGPGIAPRAVVIADWNSETARAFNGFFYSPIGSDNTPDDTKAWLGLTLSTGDHIQQVIWSHGTGVVEGYVRTGHEHSATVQFSAWEPMQAEVPEVALYLNDLLDVNTASSDDGDILEYDTTTSTWVTRAFTHTHSGADVSTVQPTANPVPRVVVGPGAAIVTWDSKATEVYDLYVAESNASGPTSADLHTSFEGIRPPVWVRSTPGGTALNTTTSYYFAVQARNAGGSGPALTSSDWVEGRAGTIDPQYLVLNADVAGINELFVEILQAVDVTISGDFTANTLTAAGKATFFSDDNELAPGSKFYLKKGTSAPTSPVLISQDWDYDAITSLGNYSGGVWSGGLWYTTKPSTKQVVSIDPATGAATVRASLGALASPNTMSDTYDVTKIGTDWYVSGSLTGGGGCVVHKFNSSWVLQSSFYRCASAMTTNGTNLILVTNPSTALSWQIVNPTTGAVVTGAVSPGSSNFEPTSALYVDAVDATALLYIGTATGLIRAYDLAGTRDSTQEFPVPTDLTGSEVNAILYDGTLFHTYGNIKQDRLFEHTNDFWTSTSFDKRWAVSTWTNGTEETDKGTETWWLPKKRARTTTSLAVPLPTGVTAFKAYMGHTSTATTTPPTRANLWYYGTDASAFTVTAAPTFAGPNTNPPIANGFTNSDPAEFKSWDGTYTGFDADGDADLRNLTLSAAGITLLRSALMHPEWSIKLHRSATIAMTDSTDTLISWDDEIDDPGLMHSGVTAAVTIPAGASGYYDLHLSAYFAASAVGRRTLIINKNSAAVPVINQIELTRNANATASTTSIGGVWPSVPLVAGDVLRMWVWQNSGGALNLNEAYFAARWIKP